MVCFNFRAQYAETIKIEHSVEEKNSNFSDTQNNKIHSKLNNMNESKQKSISKFRLILLDHNRFWPKAWDETNRMAAKGGFVTKDYLEHITM